MTLRDYWPYPTFRDGQEKILDKVYQVWDNSDVVVIRLPTAWGKTPLSVAIQNWQLEQGHSAAITVPNNNLRKQNCEEWPHLKTVRAMKDYWLDRYNMTEEDFRKRIYKYGPKDSEYNRDKKAVKRVGTPICVNYHSYIAHKLQRNVVIVDEAHLLLNTLRDFAARRLWHFQYGYPSNIRTLAQLKQWADQQDDGNEGIKQLKEELESLSPATLVEAGWDLYRGEEKHCIKLIPLSVENSPPFFWPNKTNKIVLISATIGREDIKRMGLATRRVSYIDAASPIPAANRAIKRQYVGNMSYSQQDKNLDALVDRIKELRDSHDGNGFVHASYSLAQKIKQRMAGCDWAVFHERDPKKKQEAYDKFAETPSSERKVMIGSGFEAGVDMKYDIACWQAIAKVPYPSLAEPAIRWVAKNQSAYYTWVVSQTIMQACGRVCRAPDDIGITYILDSSFDGWFERSKDELPLWFHEALEEK